MYCDLYAFCTIIVIFFPRKGKFCLWFVENIFYDFMISFPYSLFVVYRFDFLMNCRFPGCVVLGFFNFAFLLTEECISSIQSSVPLSSISCFWGSCQACIFFISSFPSIYTFFILSLPLGLNSFIHFNLLLNCVCINLVKVFVNFPLRVSSKFIKEF